MIKFCKILGAYPRYLKNLYEQHPEMSDLSFESQMMVLEEDGFGSSDFWKVNLEKIGGFDVRFILVNAEIAQKQWAKEHHFEYDKENWAESIVMEQLKEFKPDVVFAHDYNVINPVVVSKIRRSIPSVKVVMGWDGIDLKQEYRFENYDLVLSCNKRTVEYYRSKGLKSYYLLFGFEKSILNRISPIAPQYEITFVGSLTLRKGGHNTRLKVLGEVARHLPLDCWLSDFDKPRLYFYKNIVKKLVDAQFQEFFDCLRLSMKNRNAIYAMEMYNVLAHSRFTLNTHIDVALGYAGNGRLFEATGLGTCLVTDNQANMEFIFKKDEEVIVYNSPEECVEKISYLMKHEKEREAIAKAGQKRTLENYSWEKRIREFLPEMYNLLT